MTPYQCIHFKLTSILFTHITGITHTLLGTKLIHVNPMQATWVPTQVHNQWKKKWIITAKIGTSQKCQIQKTAVR